MANQDKQMDEDVKILHSMGYAQELSRRMGLFQNFAISFSIICILAGGITAFPVSLSAAGGASLGIGWPIACIFALLVACSLGQVASAYPTAGGIYHWASILGGRGYGWGAAWLNLLGLMFVVSSVNVGLWWLIRDLLLPVVFHSDTASLVSAEMFDKGWWWQTIAVIIITGVQGWVNHRGIRMTTLLTDFAGYLIFGLTVILILALLMWAPVSIDIGRLFTFSDFTGDAGGAVWPTPASERWLGAIFPASMAALILGLLQGVYTITGFDASGHTSEETRNAAREVPKGMIHSVFWSALFGYIMVATFVLALPSVEEGAAQGWLAFPFLMEKSLMPVIIKDLLIIGIVVSNFLCALAGLTSCSRMLYAFSRDGGVPWVSGYLRKVSKEFRTPAHAIWAAAVLSVIATLYAAAFYVLATGCAVFLYVSYLMPIVAGLANEGKWTKKGPFDLGTWSKPVALLAAIGCVILVIVGVQPPNEKVGYLLFWGIVAMVVIWYTVERNRFQGPPLTEEAVKARQAEIAREEAALES